MAEMRLEILMEPALTGETVTEVCARRGISRDAFYRFKRRYEAAGMAGLTERSHRPLTSPNQMDPELEELICRMRRDHPRWGARRIRAELLRAGIAPPATSTIHRALQRNHLVAPQPKKKPRKLFVRFERDEPNDLWQIDATEIRLTDRKKVWIVDIIDDYARFMVAARAYGKVPNADDVCALFEQAARRHGLPRQVLSDNALTFTGRRLGHEVAFQRLLAALGVKLINGTPGHPQTQGKIERFHGTLKGWIQDQGGARDLEHLQRLLGRFRRHYNAERPNQGIADLTPADRYRRSPRAYRLRSQLKPDYAEGAIVRKVSRVGALSYDMNTVFVGAQWSGCSVEVLPRNGMIEIFFGAKLLRVVPHFREGGTHPLKRPSRPHPVVKGA